MDPENRDAQAFLATAERAQVTAATLPSTRTSTPIPATTPATSPDHPTSFANGRCQIKAFLGEGGKKKVYSAQATLLDESPAISSEMGMRPLRRGPGLAGDTECVAGRPTSLERAPLEVTE